MRVLVLGGTVFLSRAIAAEALRRGHEVVCAARGTSGSVPEGARLVAWDRAGGGVPDELSAGGFDAVVDVARHPSWVRTAVAALPGAHWLLVSSVSVYPDEATPGQTPADAVHEAQHEDRDLAVDPDAYGPMKVACEQVVRAGAALATVVRPGLIVGPGDPTGRYSYWPARLADTDAGPVLAPGSPDDVVQVIDVRDLATWSVDLLEQGRPGTFDGVGPPLPLHEALRATAEGVGTDPDLTWVPHDDLLARGVEPWSGPGSLPLWLPRPSYDGMLAHDPAPSYDAGLVVRPLADTARDTLAWLRATPDAVVTGMTREREREVLASLA